MKRDMTVWIGAAWYRDCDPCMRVVYGPTHTQETADKAFRRDMRDYEKWSNAGQEQDRDEHGRFLPFPALYWPGQTYPESLRTILQDCRNRHERRDIVEGLRTSGRAHLGGF